MTLYKLFTDEQGHQVEDKLGCYLRQHRRRPRVLPKVWRSGLTLPAEQRAVGSHRPAAARLFPPEQIAEIEAN